MIAPNAPANESDRLRALAEYQIVDSVTEASFDALTTLVARVLSVPIALISIIDEDRQWFKSRVGLEAQQTPRDISFCGHVVAVGAPLVVNDALLDARFADNPLTVGDPHVRFYAGMPLRTVDGFDLGTLCAIDHVPRELSAVEFDTLSLLAKQVVALLELRRKELQLAALRRTFVSHIRFFEVIPDLVATSEADVLFKEVNPYWETLMGWTPTELRAQSLEELVHPDDLAATLAEGARLLSHDGSVGNFENRYRHKDGHWVPLLWTAISHDHTIFASARDMTALKSKEALLLSKKAALRESEAKLRALFEGMVEGVVLQSASGVVEAHNSATESILGLGADQIRGVVAIDPGWRAVRADGSPLPETEYPAMVALATGVAQSNVVMGVQKPCGFLVWISVNSQPLIRDGESAPYAVVTTFRDITEQRTLEKLSAHIAKKDRLITTGTLAAGVGHEINNPLTYILGNLDFALEELGSVSRSSPSARITELVTALTEAREGTERVRKIVRGLRSLAREEGALSPTNVRGVVDLSVNMAMHELRRRATVVYDIADVPMVMADESRLAQILVNLLVNAAQAFSTDDPSINTVTLSAGVPSDGRVEIRVTDNGSGISPEVLPRIFDPFFTTKAVGQGTGLGLSISMNIVLGLGGELTCESSPGEGTSFILTLAACTAAERIAANDSSPPVRGRGRVLVVDDDQTVLRSITRLLRDDYDVEARSDPREALKTLEADGQFDVIFCDIMMPILTGMELYHRVRAMSPETAGRFVFISGGVTRDDIARFLAEIPNERIEKPFSFQALRAIAGRLVATHQSAKNRAR